MQKKNRVIAAIACFLTILLYIPVSAMEGLNSVACTAESKIDVLIETLPTIESKICVVELDSLTLESKVDLIDTSAILAKACTVESRVDLLQSDITTLESKVDVIDVEEETVESTVDAIANTISSLFSKVCTLDSHVDVLADNATTIESQLDTIITIDSKVDIAGNEGLTLESKLCIIDSKVEIADNTMLTIANELTTIESRVDTLDAKLDTMVLSSQTLESTVDAIDTTVSTVLVCGQSLESKLCVVDSKVEVIDGELDALKTTINGSDNKAQTIFGDFQETWTALNPILGKLCSIESKTDLVSSLIDTVEFAIDQSGTFTEIAAILQKACTVGSQVDEINNVIIQAGLSYDGTFTVLDDTLEKLCNADSFVDELALSTTVLDGLQACLGTPIRQEDVGTTGFTISTRGRYYLAENIVFLPSSAADFITITADNVFLDLNGKTMQQGNLQTNVCGIAITGTRNNIAIVGGTLFSFKGEGIIVSGGSNTIENLLLDRLIFENIGEGIGGSPEGVDAVCINDGSNIIVRNSQFLRTVDEGIDLNGCTDILIENSLFADTQQSSGLLFGASGGIGCSRVMVRKCIFLGNDNSGIEITNQVTFQSFCIDECLFSGNSGEGIVMGGGAAGNTTIQDCVIKNSVFEGNLNGIRIQDGATANTTRRLVIINNQISNNTVYGIHLDDTASNNIILFNSFVQNGTANIFEDTGTGPNSILGNFAYHSGGDSSNYSLGNTSITGAKSVISQSGAFPTTLPTYWYNISMTP